MPTILHHRGGGVDIVSDLYAYVVRSNSHQLLGRCAHTLLCITLPTSNVRATAGSFVTRISITQIIHPDRSVVHAPPTDRFVFLCCAVFF